MTTIAIKGGIVAADSQATGHNGLLDQAVKLAALPKGGIAAAAGDSGRCMAFLKAVAKGEAFDFSADKHHPLEAVIVRPGEPVMTRCCGEPYWSETYTEFQAFGAGGFIALGAMGAGLTAVEAVGVAMRLTCYSGGVIHHMRVGGDGELFVEDPSRAGHR